MSAVTNLAKYQSANLVAWEILLRRSFPAFTTALILAVATLDYRVSRPAVPFRSYLPLRALEDLAYSAGVTSGILRPSFILAIGRMSLLRIAGRDRNPLPRLPANTAFAADLARYPAEPR
jgi:hypothetical protein